MPIGLAHPLLKNRIPIELITPLFVSRKVRIEFLAIKQKSVFSQFLSLYIIMNTTYYILGPDDTEQDVINSSHNVLGETSFNTFHTQQGFTILMKLINQGSSLLANIRIKDSKGNTLSITEFLASIETYQIR